MPPCPFGRGFLLKHLRAADQTVIAFAKEFGYSFCPSADLPYVWPRIRSTFNLSIVDTITLNMLQ